jgi:uncharacterized membrane protein
MKTTRPTYNQIAGQNLHRTEALADGVFAIAMTILVFDLKAPADQLVNSEGQIWQRLALMAPKFLTYLLGFMTLGIFWVGHTTQLTHLARTDRHSTWLNILFLMLVSLLPFTTAFLNEHIEYRSALLVYWLNIMLCGVVLYVHWHYCVRHKLIEESEESAIVVKTLYRRIVFAQLLYAAGGLLCLFNNYLSIGAILAVQFNYALGLTGGSPKPIKSEESDDGGASRDSTD